MAVPSPSSWAAVLCEHWVSERRSGAGLARAPLRPQGLWGRAAMAHPSRGPRLGTGTRSRPSALWGLRSGKLGCSEVVCAFTGRFRTPALSGVWAPLWRGC